MAVIVQAIASASPCRCCGVSGMDDTGQVQGMLFDGEECANYPTQPRAAAPHKNHRFIHQTMLDGALVFRGGSSLAQPLPS